MIIHEFFYNDDNRSLYIEFSTDNDGDNFYRVLNLGFEDIEYYSPEIIDDVDLEDIDEDFVIELINQYSKENDLPDVDNGFSPDYVAGRVSFNFAKKIGVVELVAEVRTEKSMFIKRFKRCKF